jgi:AcrR family transcriptional regulator
MQSAAAQQATALDRLKAAGLAYVEFALRRPEHFAVMFDAPRAARHGAKLPLAEKQAFESIVELVRDCQDAGQLPHGNSIDFAFLAWAMVHGIAKLATTGRLAQQSTSDILKFAEFVIDQSLPRGPVFGVEAKSYKPGFTSG